MLNIRGFVKLKNPKIREKLGSGWVGQAPTHNYFCVKFCVFFVFFVLLFFAVHVSPQKIINWIEGWVGVVWPIRVFLGFR